MSEKEVKVGVDCLKCKRLEVDCPYQGNFDIGMVTVCDSFKSRKKGDVDDKR